MKTTVQVDRPTLERLAKHKRFERESYDDVLNFILDEFEQEPLSVDDIAEIQDGLNDIKVGKFRRIEDVAKDLGIKL